MVKTYADIDHKPIPFGHGGPPFRQAVNLSALGSACDQLSVVARLWNQRLEAEKAEDAFSNADRPPILLRFLTMSFIGMRLPSCRAAEATKPSP